MTSIGREKTRDMLRYLADGPEACVIAHQVRLAPEDADTEDARRLCYRGLAIELVSGRRGVWDPIDLRLGHSGVPVEHCYPWPRETRFWKRPQ